MLGFEGSVGRKSLMVLCLGFLFAVKQSCFLSLAVHRLRHADRGEEVAASVLYASC